jgi:PIN domain nuclease of toxin-antitoxin system
MKAFITIDGSASLAAVSRESGIFALIPVSSYSDTSISAVELDHLQNLLYIARLQAAIQGFAFMLDARLLSLHKILDYAFF